MGADGLATGELREFEAFAPVLALAGETRINLGIATGMEPGNPAHRGRTRRPTRPPSWPGPEPLRRAWDHRDGEHGWQPLHAGNPA